MPPQETDKVTDSRASTGASATAINEAWSPDALKIIKRQAATSHAGEGSTGFIDFNQPGDAGSQSVARDSTDSKIAKSAEIGSVSRGANGNEIKKISETEYEMTVSGGNRKGSATVMVPDGYDPAKEYPVVVGIHNFNGNRTDMGTLIGAEKLRKQGYIVLLPNADGAEWQGKGVAITWTGKGENGKKIDDPDFVMKAIDYTKQSFTTDDKNLNIFAFSQGVSVGYEVAKRMDAQKPGAVNEVVMAAGTNSYPNDLPGTRVVQYMPGNNTLGHMEEWSKWAPSDAAMPQVVEMKGCGEPVNTFNNGDVLKRDYVCKDNAKLTRIYEKNGEHAWPGQPSIMDHSLFGRGSISTVKLTELFLRHQTEDGKLKVQRTLEK